MITEQNFPRRILALGPNPAWQKTLFFNELHPGEVNRAHAMKSFASGKGINFCRAARNWGNKNVELLQFAGGITGSDLCSYLEDEGIPNHTVMIAEATRTCYTCLSIDQPMTELIEPSPLISEKEICQYHDLLSANIERFGGAAFAGLFRLEAPSKFTVKRLRLLARLIFLCLLIHGRILLLYWKLVKTLFLRLTPKK